MNKQSFISILLTMLMSMIGAKAFAYDIAATNKDGVKIYYVWANDAKTELSVSFNVREQNTPSDEYSGNVIIPESVEHEGSTYRVTSIGNDAFYFCNELTSVTIPSSVTSIEDMAFFACVGLTSVNIPNSVTSIGDLAFGGCTSLANIAIPNSVTTIGIGAFCVTGLTSVTIPSSVTSIGTSAFERCSSLTSITSEIEKPFEIQYNVFDFKNNITLLVPAGTLAAYQSTLWWNLFANIFEKGEGGVVGYKFLYEGLYYEIDNNNTVAVTSGDVKYSGDIEIPDHATFNGKTYSVTSISKQAFAYSDLTSVSIPNSVTSIGEGAFSGCSGLTSVTIPNSVTLIDKEAFYGCRGLTSITIPNSVAQIGDKAFYSCSSLKTIYSEIKKPFEIADVFDYKNATLIVPAGTLVSYQSTSGWKLFTNIFETGEGGIVGYKFLYEGLYYKIGNNNTVAVTSGDVKYSGDIEIPDHATFNGKTYSVTSISKEAFTGSGLTSVTIPNSVTQIEDNAFKSCSSLPSIIIPNSVISIGSFAFQYCSGLTSVTIPNSVTAIGQFAFEYCSGLTSVIIGTGATSIEHNAFYDCDNIKKLEFHCKEIGSWFGSWDSPSGINEVIIGDEVISIGDNAFNEFYGLTSITIPNSVTSIGKSAFENCYNLESVTWSNHLTSIGNGAFKYCNSLTFVEIPQSVKSIDDGAFYGCSKLQSVIIGNGVKSIGSNAFGSCSELNSIIIGSSVISISQSAFYRTTNIKKTIWLPNTPPEFVNDYFYSEINYVSNDLYPTTFNNQVKYQFLSSYFEVDGVRYVPVSMSERICDAIDCVYDKNVADLKITSTVLYNGITMNVRNINPYLAFNNNYIMTSTIDINGELPDYAFANCSYLEKVIYGKNINRLGKGVFSGCSTLASLISLEKTSFPNEICISNSINTIDDYAFNGCTAAKNIIIMDCDTELKLGANKIIVEVWDSSTGTSLFFDCPLDSVYIGRDISYNTDKRYGYSPFFRNSSLRAVKITDKETEISENEFYGCTNLQKVIIGDGVTTFGDRSFSGCSSLKQFAFGTQVKSIGQEAFSDCRDMVEIDCKAFTPPFCGSQALDDINKWQCKLYVPKGSKGAYQGAEQWKEFILTEEGTGTIVIDDVLGDANGDGNINDDDIREIENYILSKPSAKFIFKNADANGDNVVNAADIVKVINIIKKI